ncbi:MAG: Ig-like domain-containing protein [Methylococcaceae bacterium]|nr:Ig-like domain-containing protein [Methylococcaceae bacterium]
MKKSILSGLLFGTLALGAGTANALTDIYLIAKPYTVNMPGANNGAIPMWGYAIDVNGACYNTAGAPSVRKNALACTTPAASSPAPGNIPLQDGLVIPAGETSVRIFLTNLLPERTSVVIDGQDMPYSSANKGPTWTDNSIGPRTNNSQRVRSFGREAGANGGRMIYVWTAFRNTPFSGPGSFLLHSGTHPQLQVQMGLYGLVRQNQQDFIFNPATQTVKKEAYPGVFYDFSPKNENEVILFYSEIDPAFHETVAAGGYGPNGTITSTLKYHPTLFLINGQPYQAGITGGIDIGDPGEVNLVRFINAGLETHMPIIEGARMQVLAEDGNVYPFPRDQYSIQIPAMKTKDVLLVLPEPGVYPVVDHMLSLSNPGTAVSGGMIAKLGATAGFGEPVANTDGYTVAEGGTKNVAATAGVLINDVTNGAILNTTPIIAPANASSFTLNADGSFTYVHDGSETVADTFVYEISNSNGISQAFVNISITPVNDAPVAVADTVTTIPKAVPTTLDGIPTAGSDSVGQQFKLIYDRDPVAIAVLANDTDPENDVLSIASFTQPTTGSVEAGNGGRLIYIPVQGATGTFTFSYTMKDASGAVSNSATVSITVSAFINEAPVTVKDLGRVPQNVIAENIVNGVPQPIAGLQPGEINLTLDPLKASLVDILGNDSDDGLLVDPVLFDGRTGLPEHGSTILLGKRHTINGMRQVHSVTLPGTTIVRRYPIIVTRRGGLVAYNGDGKVLYRAPLFFRGVDGFSYFLRDGGGATATNDKNLLSNRASVRINVVQ